MVAILSGLTLLCLGTIVYGSVIYYYYDYYYYSTDS